MPLPPVVAMVSLHVASCVRRNHGRSFIHRLAGDMTITVSLLTALLNVAYNADLSAQTLIIYTAFAASVQFLL